MLKLSKFPTFMKAASLIGLMTLAIVSTNSPGSVKEAPASHVLLLDGSKRNLTQLGEKTVIVFWATWCPPCKVELARLNRLVEANPEMAGKIIAISVGEPADLVRKAVRERGYKFGIGTDEASELAEKYNVAGTPTVLLKDGTNVIVWSTAGLSPTLELRVKSHLADGDI